MAVEGHNQKFADAFASILADDPADEPDRKKARQGQRGTEAKADSDVVRKRVHTRRLQDRAQLFCAVDALMSALVSMRVHGRCRSCREWIPAKWTEKSEPRRAGGALLAKPRLSGAWSALRIA